MLRRYLPFVLVAGLCTIVIFTTFRSLSWRQLPQSVGSREYVDGLQEGNGAGTMGPGGKPGYRTEDVLSPGIDSHSTYPVGHTKPPGSNYTRTLVLARTTTQDTSWISEELSDMLETTLSTAIYVVDNRSAPLHPPQNKGHEVMVYLSYIIDHYENLPDVAMFMHYHRFAWHNNELLDTDAAMMVRFLSPERVTREGYMNLRCHWDPGCPAWLHPGATQRDYNKQEEHIIAQSWTQLFPLDPIPSVLAQPCCAQFAVSRDRVLATPKQRYVSLRDWVLRTELSDYLSGRIFEYVWQFIFTASPIHCPSMSACYCDGYGLCFGDQFERWFELRFDRNEYEEELRVWKEKAELIAFWKEQNEGGKLTEEALLEVPVVGRDQFLQRQIDDLNAQMNSLRLEAYRRGKDPRQRALGSGREWHDGDGF